MDVALLFEARARVLADLEARHRATPDAVSALEEAVSARSWWADQWPEGAQYVAGLVAQDVQDALVDGAARWPVCDWCDEEAEHMVHISPDLGGPDPAWVCEASGTVVAPLGNLPKA